ncbi:UvrB/UvrC motif-containing protein [Proteinivorax hydrogeniformans]|uniref:UvrB/UvrC motif-containing protein n=1 Tax=Proteinivorax hydrogeniformans TaxID=1826727 RepID=A0AAU8HTF6_9FIRM
MVCQECKKKQATVHFTKIINGEKIELKLCESCAEQRGDLDFDGQQPFSVHQLLAGLLDLEEMPNVKGQTTTSNAGICKNCGLTEMQFAKIGRLGCTQCYQTFGARLNPLLKRVQGRSSHNGKVPKRSGGDIKLKREIEKLRESLNRYVIEEKFEDAAVLRDKIKALESELTQGGGA